MELRVKVEIIKTLTTKYYVVLIKKVIEKHNLKNMYESIIQSLTDGILAIDTNGKIRIYNKSQGKIEGYKKEEVLDKKVKDIYKLNEETSNLLKVLREKKPVENIKQAYYTQEGKRIYAVTSAFPLIYEDKFLGAAAIVRDYSEICKLIDENIEIKKKIAKNKDYLNKDDKNRKKRLSIHYKFSDIITEDKKLLEDISWAKLSARNDSNVLIYGKTGTGKELFAQSIHSFSKRSENPFLALNCAAIPEALFESLLFGTTKGAFTGAVDKVGLFEQAEGGTLFLDEINSMPIMLQAKLLRVLEEKMIMRLGDNKYIPVSVRIISSCNEDPRYSIEKNKFREDLFFRLSVSYIKIPTLKERKNDIDILYKHFIRIYNKKYNKSIKDIDEEVREFFEKYDWPGNVRELKHIIESSINITDEESNYLQLSDMPSHVVCDINVNKNIEINKMKNNINKEKLLKNNDILKQMEINEYNKIIECLIEAKGNVAKAARIMGISRQKMHYRLKKYNIK